MKKLLRSILLFFSFIVASAQAPADVETSFGAYPGFNNIVSKILRQPDGKILACGNFTQYKGRECKYFVRLLADGNVDPAFNTGTGFLSYANTMALQADGKIIVSGTFTQYNSQSSNYIIRLNANGSRDMTFDAGYAYMGSGGAREIVIQPDNKIIIFGQFSNFNTVACMNVVRLNPDGSVDTTFATGSGFNDVVNSVAVQPDGKMVVVGNFTNYNGYTRNRIIRLDADASVDLTFSIGVGFPEYVEQVLVQDDGKVIVTGTFSSYKNQTEHGLIRLLADGSKDTSFNVGTGLSGGIIRDAAIDSDGKILLAGTITNFNGIATNANCVRVNTNGSLDTAFTSQHPGSVYSLIPQNAGKIILGGANCISRIQSNGSIDPTFDFGRGFNDTVYATLLQPDGKIIIGGSFNLFNLNRENGLIRLNADGTKDTTFNLDYFTYGETKKLILQPNGKILAFGTYQLNDSPSGSYSYMLRFNADGSRDTSFIPNSYSSMVYSIALQPDGKILLGGVNFFVSPNTITTGLIRLNANGTFDNSFNVGGSGFNLGWLDCLLVQPEGKIIVVGGFTQFNGEQHQGIVRLLPNGSLDSTFNTGEGFSHHAHTAVLQPDGKILVGGSFIAYNVIPAWHIARLNTDGSFDATFAPGVNVQNVFDIAVQSDGKILAAGSTSQYGTTVLKSLVRFESDGNLDSNFNVGAGFSPFTVNGNPIKTIQLEPDGKIILGGTFVGYNETSSSNLIRLAGGNTLSTDNFDGAKAVLYPNPARDFLYLDFPAGAEPIGYEILDLTGKKLLQGTNSESAIDVQSLSKGMYFIKINGPDAEAYNIKFFKE
jgi:uncharacterized delta-60 repeat protein